MRKLVLRYLLEYYPAPVIVEIEFVNRIRYEFRIYATRIYQQSELCI
jgi:hypothetical protein